MDLFILCNEDTNNWYPAGKLEIEKYLEFLNLLKTNDKLNSDYDGEPFTFEIEGKKINLSFNRTIIDNKVPKDIIINIDTLKTTTIIGVRFSDLQLLSLNVFKDHLDKILKSWLEKNNKIDENNKEDKSNN